MTPVGSNAKEDKFSEHQINASFHEVKLTVLVDMSPCTGGRVLTRSLAFTWILGKVEAPPRMRNKESDCSRRLIPALL